MKPNRLPSKVCVAVQMAILWPLFESTLWLGFAYVSQLTHLLSHCNPSASHTLFP